MQFLCPYCEHALVYARVGIRDKRGSGRIIHFTKEESAPNLKPVDATVYRSKNASIAMFLVDRSPAPAHLPGSGFKASDIEYKGRAEPKVMAEAGMVTNRDLSC